jgi:membrane protein implicated in regulation of membrane protease activity
VEPGLIWILAGLALLGAEMALPGVFLLWVGLAAVGTGLLLLVAAPGFGLTVLAFLWLLALGIFASLHLKRRGGPAHRVNAPEAGLAGRQAVVLAADGPGLRVRLGDSEWQARLPRGVETPGAGTLVRVEGVDGTVLVVRPDAAAGA